VALREAALEVEAVKRGVPFFHELAESPAKRVGSTSRRYSGSIARGDTSRDAQSTRPEGRRCIETPLYLGFPARHRSTRLNPIAFLSVEWCEESVSASRGVSSQGTRLVSARLSVGLSLVLAALSLIAGAAVAMAHHAPSVPRIAPPAMYIIEGYLDRAPAKATVVDRVQIFTPGRQKRWLLVTSYRAPGEVMLGDYLSWPLENAYAVSGTREEVDRLFDCAAGAEVKGTFVVYAPAYPVLVIAELDQPPEAATESGQGSAAGGG
jgi:hypothetical protein